MKEAVTGGARRHRGESEWRGLIVAQQRSGLSQRAFCEQEGVCAQSLRNWRRRLGLVTRSPASAQQHEGAAAAFVEIGAAVPGALDAGLRVRLDLGAGVVLELSRR